MKTAKMVIGIISIVLFVIITFQSCAAGIGNAINENSETSGTAGLILAICMLIAGIIGIAAKCSKGGAITAGVIYAIGGIVGLVNMGSFADLMIWSILALIFAVIFIIGAFFPGKECEEKIISNSENANNS